MPTRDFLNSPSPETFHPAEYGSLQDIDDDRLDGATIHGGQISFPRTGGAST
jgi:hypothetical protein